MVRRSEGSPGNAAALTNALKSLSSTLIPTGPAAPCRFTAALTFWAERQSLEANSFLPGLLGEQTEERWEEERRRRRGVLLVRPHGGWGSVHNESWKQDAEVLLPKPSDLPEPWAPLSSLLVLVLAVPPSPPPPERTQQSAS